MYSVAKWLLDQIHIGLVPALLGALLALKGVTIFVGRRYTLAAAKQHDQDRLRRIREYRKQQEPVLSIDREVMDGVERQVMDDRTDFDLIDTAERAWREERTDPGASAAAALRGLATRVRLAIRRRASAGG